jgi:nucleoid-associated protein YgaU
MAQNPEQDFREDEEKERAAWPIPLVVLLIAAAAAGGGYWLTTRNAPPVVQSAKVETSSQTPAAQVPAATSAEVPSKPEDAQVSASVEVAKPAEMAKPAVPAAPEVTVTEPAPVAEAKPTAVVEPPAKAKDVAKVEEPKVVVEPPKAEVPKVAAEPPKAQDTQVAVAAPEPEAIVPKAEAPKLEAPKVEPPKAVDVAPAEAPSFDTVRVEPNGDAVIAGRAAPGTEVTIKLGTARIGMAKADGNGSFVFISEQPLPAGAAALSLESLVNGKILASEQTVAVAVKGDSKSEPMVAVVKPGEPTKVIQAPKAADTIEPVKSVKLDAVDYDAQGNIIFTGRGRPNSLVRLYVDNAPAGEVKSDVDGRWIFAGTSSVVAGTHMLRADEIGPDGKVSSRIELPFLREEPAKVAAVQTQPPAVPETKPAEAKPAGAAAAEEPPAEVKAPAAAPALEVAQTNSSAASQATEPPRMVIQPGNNLWKLSRQVYGKGIRYTVIYEANKSQIRDPDLIYPGQVFVMPVAQP